MRPIFCALGLAALALAACQPQDPEGKSAEAPADAPLAANASPTQAAAPDPFEGDINALGDEPFWAVQIRNDTITLQRPDRPDMTVANPGSRRDGENAVFDSTDPRGRLVVILKPGGCTGAMNGFSYPFAAEVQVAQDYLKGCAAKADAMPRE